MDPGYLTIDQLYKYEIDQELEGGMGRVLLLTRRSGPQQSPLNRAILERRGIQELFRYPYRAQLAAKTVKDSHLMRDFERECLVWLDLAEDGIVPLLKVVRIDALIYALMPRYGGSLKDLLQARRAPPSETLKLLELPILGLAQVHKSKGLVHQDIKPQNFLFEDDGSALRLFLSDWGIANVQENSLASARSISERFTFQTMAGFGTLPYMAPERLLGYHSTIGADIFSLGIVFIEVITGSLPYILTDPIEEQLVSAKYFSTAKYLLDKHASSRLSRSVLSMIHPLPETRMQDYKGVAAVIRSL